MLLPIILFSDNLENNAWYAGYYINLKSDTIKGYVKHRNRPSNYFASFKFPNGKTKELNSNEINGYGYSNMVFESCNTFLQNIFLERVLDGKITLYRTDKTFYIKKGNSDIVKVNRVFVKQIILEYISDYPELSSRVDEFEYLLSYEIAPVIQQYNVWASRIAAEQNIFEPKPLSNDTSKIIGKNDSIQSASKPVIKKNKFEFAKQKHFTPKLNLFGLGIGLETKIGNSCSIYLEGGSGFEIKFSSSEGGSSSLLAYGKFQFRIYTNLKKRQIAGKKTMGFTGDFLSPFFTYTNVISDSRIERINSIFYGINYGFQRQKAKHIFWGIDIGGGLRTNINNGAINVDYLLNLNFGFTL